MSSFSLYILFTAITLLSSFLIFPICHCQEKQTLRIYALSALSNDYYGGYVVGAQRLAANKINNDSNLLQNYNISIEALDGKGDTTETLIISLETSSTPSLQVSNSTIAIPFILGAPFSSLSIITSPALAAFNWAQISSAATSVLLSDSTSYPTFYRSIASDGLQSQGIITLCDTFNWTRIGVLYTNSNYGVYLTNGIIERGRENGIKVNAIAFIREDKSSYTNAAKTMADIGVFIIVVIAHAGDLYPLFSACEEQGIWGFPYFYLGVDSWLDQARISNHNVSRYAKGYLGTVPWQPTTLDYDAYEKNGLGEMYNVATSLLSELESAWEYEYSVNPGFSTNLDGLNSKSIYGWDSMYTIAHALEIFDQKYNIKENILQMNSSFIIKQLNHIVLNDVSFLSVTGNVSYLENGDRHNGLYAFGNVVGGDSENATERGKVKYFGYFTDTGIVEVDFDGIVWPDDFREKGVTPRSESLMIISYESINPVLYIIVMVLSVISIFLVLASIIYMFMHRSNDILKAASWRLNQLTCFGCVLAYITLIIYGIRADNDFICNAREWMVIISFSLGFMPLFAKTYRISYIFNGVLQLKKSKIEDKHLVGLVGVCVVIDLVILTVFTIIEPDTVTQYESRVVTVHELESIQYNIRACTKVNDTINLVYYGVLLAWKLIELIFGVYVVLTVSRIGMKELHKFKETEQQFRAIVFTLVMFLLAIMPMVQYGADENAFYVIISVVTLSVFNVVWGANLTPRLKAIYYKEEDTFTLTDLQLATKFIRTRFKSRTQTTQNNLFQSFKDEPNEQTQIPINYTDTGHHVISDSAASPGYTTPSPMNIDNKLS